MASSRVLFQAALEELILSAQVAAHETSTRQATPRVTSVIGSLEQNDSTHLVWDG